MHNWDGTLRIRFVFHVLVAMIIPVLILLSGCIGTPASPAPVDAGQVAAGTPAGASWKETPLTDLQGRGNFSIGSFAGKTVIVPVVSVSCASCIVQLSRQLDEAGRAARQSNDSARVVVLDIDPDTGPGFFAASGDPGSFDGYSARVPEEMSLQIFRRFGPFAVDTTSVPVILVCPDGHDLLLPPGLKTVESLSGTMAREC